MQVVTDKNEFLAQLPVEGRLLAIDHGKQRIGVAISDMSRWLVNPLTTLEHPKFAVNAEMIRRICDEQKVCGLVIGYPLNMDGSEGPRCQSVRAFARNLEQYVPQPLLLWDERLSSAIAHELMVEAKLPAAKRGSKVDKLAAQAILQSFLEDCR